ncbi:MAG: YARHG domain-containing protein [Eubacteriales bacterium]|nr:YARHG domain-containing protein [Eubacteriales bacterium]
MRSCKYCGMEMYDDDLFCTRCGKRADEETAEAVGTPVPDGTAGLSAAAAGPAIEEAGKAKKEEGRGKAAGVGTAAGGAAAARTNQHPRMEKGTKKAPKREPAKVTPVKKEAEEEERNGFIPLAFAAILILLLGLFLPRLFSGTSPSKEPSAQTAQADPAGQEAGDVQEAAGNEGKENAAGSDLSGQTAGADTQEPGEAAAAAGPGTAAGEQNTAQGQQTDSGTPAEEKETASSPEEKQGEAGKEEQEQKAKAEEYILPEGDTRYYTPEEVASLDDVTLQMAINELCARHGRIFSADDTRTYFESKSWYKGTIDAEEFDSNLYSYFNEFEAGNFSMLAQVRESRAAAAQTQAAPVQSEPEAAQPDTASQRPEVQNEGNWDDNTLYNVDSGND